MALILLTEKFPSVVIAEKILWSVTSHFMAVWFELAFPSCKVPWMKEQTHKGQEIFLHLQQPLNSISRHSPWEWKILKFYMFSLTQVITLKEGKLTLSYLLRRAPRFNTFYNENSFPGSILLISHLFKMVQIKWGISALTLKAEWSVSSLWLED